MKKHTIIQMGLGQPFEPIYWWRYSHRLDDAKFVIDDQIEIPGCEPVGFAIDVNTTNRLPTVMDPNSFQPRQTVQTVQIFFRNQWLVGAIKGLFYSFEAQQDLRSVHNIDAEEVFIEVFAGTVEQWLRGLMGS
jgi:hypothetical protein